MSAQKRESKKNFIAIVSEINEEQRVEHAAQPERPARRGLLGLIAAALGHINT